MVDEAELGGYFTRSYLQSPSLNEDDHRARFRIAKYLEEYTARDSGDIGRFIEQQLGIPVLKHGGNGKYVRWAEEFEKCDLVDFLDMLTAVAKHSPAKTIRKGRYDIKYNFIEFVERVFREQKLAYRIDEKGGVHPFVDKAFANELSMVIAGFSDERLGAARHHIDLAEQALLAANFNGREAIRSVFDAVENIFKLMFPKANQLNNANIMNNLKPFLTEQEEIEVHEKRATEQLINSLKSWVEAGHNYRHEPGAIEPPEPSKQFCIQYVSQGIGFSRWLGNQYLNEG